MCCMAERPNNHITGDVAIRDISSKLIPEEWTINTPQSDYGLDLLVEVVNNNMTTGKFFFIQSKGTINSSQQDSISYSLEVERIKDYSKIAIPVLFVYYSKADNRFWGRWMNSLYDTLTEKQQRQKKVTLKFDSANEIDVDYLRSIGENIDISITKTVSLRCKDLYSQFMRFHSQVISVARQCIGTEISGDDRLSCKTLLVSYSGTLKDGRATLKSDKESIDVIINCNERDWLFYPILKNQDCPDCLLDLIYLIAIYSSGISIQSQNYVLSCPRSRILKLLPKANWLIFLEKLNTDKITKISKLFNEAIHCKCNEIVEYILFWTLMVYLSDDKYKELYLNLLSDYLSSDIDCEVKGMILYNMANSIRTTNIYEAFSYYVKAAHYQKIYRELYYWWQELAGILYLTNHYKFAELFYKKARRLDSNLCRDDIGILIADCLVCQGRIHDALVEERMYINDGHRLTGIVNLKMRISEMMSSRVMPVIKSSYWYNRGISESNECRFRDALESFLISWRLNDGDFEALCNALIQAIKLSADVETCLIVSALREISPDGAFKFLISVLLSTIGEERLNDIIGPLKDLFYS